MKIIIEEFICLYLYMDFKVQIRIWNSLKTKFHLSFQKEYSYFQSQMKNKQTVTSSKWV